MSFVSQAAEVEASQRGPRRCVPRCAPQRVGRLACQSREARAVPTSQKQGTSRHRLSPSRGSPGCLRWGSQQLERGEAIEATSWSFARAG